MYEPVLISKKSWDKLNDAQKKALTAASKKAEDYFEAESKKLDDETGRDLQEEQGRGRHADRRRGRRLARRGAEDLVQGLRREGARRQGADREGAECQVNAAPRLPAWVAAVHAVSRLFGVVAAGMILVSIGVICQMVFVRAVLGAVVDLADRVRHLLAGGGHLHRRALHPAHARPCRGRRRAADGRRRRRGARCTWSAA